MGLTQSNLNNEARANPKIIENNINDIEVDDFERKDISTNDLLDKKEKLNRIKKIITELKNLS